MRRTPPRCRSRSATADPIATALQGGTIGDPRVLSWFAWAGPRLQAAALLAPWLVAIRPPARARNAADLGAIQPARRPPAQSSNRRQRTGSSHSARRHKRQLLNRHLWALGAVHGGRYLIGTLQCTGIACALRLI